jgi:hypothetical protein
VYDIVQGGAALIQLLYFVLSLIVPIFLLQLFGYKLDANYMMDVTSASQVEARFLKPLSDLFGSGCHCKWIYAKCGDPSLVLVSRRAIFIKSNLFISTEKSYVRKFFLLNTLSIRYRTIH